MSLKSLWFEEYFDMMWHILDGQIFWKNILSEKINFYKSIFSRNTNIDDESPHIWGVSDKKYSSVFHLPYVHHDGHRVLFQKNKRCSSSNNSLCCHGNQGKHSLNFSRDYLIVLQEGAGITSGRPYGPSGKNVIPTKWNLWGTNNNMGKGHPL